MKKLLMMRLFALMLALLLVLPGMAETYQGEIPAEFSGAFSGSRWAGYHVAAGYTFYPAGQNSGEGVPAFFVMKKGDENVLCILEYSGGAWQFKVSSPKPIYQGDRVPVFEDEDDYNWFNLFYRDGSPGGREDVLNFFKDQKGVWRFLGRARDDHQKNTTLLINALATDGVWTPGVLYVTYKSGGQTVYENKPVYGSYENDLRYFSLSAFPVSLEDAREKLSNPPDIPAGELVAKRVRFTSGQKFPVYSGPGEQYVRAAGGKAMVSTNDWIQVFGTEKGWAMIQYDITSDHMRIGFIEASALPNNAQVSPLHLNANAASLAQAASLTDDPLFSRESIAQLPSGQQLIYLARMGDWAYVEAQLGGSAVRGFVPRSSLAGPQLSLDQVQNGRYGDQKAFANYQAKAVVNPTATGQGLDIQVYAILPEGWQNPAAGTDALIAYRLYEGNRPSQQLTRGMNQQGFSVFMLKGQTPASASIIGLVPVYAVSGERTEESLVVSLK